MSITPVERLTPLTTIVNAVAELRDGEQTGQTVECCGDGALLSKIATLSERGCAMGMGRCAQDMARGVGEVAAGMRRVNWRYRIGMLVI